MFDEPRCGEISCKLQCARLLEQVGRAWHGLEFGRAMHSRLGESIELEYLAIAVTNDEERGSLYRVELVSSKVRASPSRHNGCHIGTRLSGCLESGSCPGAGSEEPEIEFGQIVVAA